MVFFQGQILLSEPNIKPVRAAKVIISYCLNNHVSKCEKTIEQPGIFYLYAEKYLGTKDIITTAKEIYTLKGIQLKNKVDVDYNRAYTIPLTDKTTASYVINSKGMLECINTTTSHTPVKKQHKNPVVKPEESKSHLTPFNEEQMRANSIGKMAEEVAQQIYRIRENRLNLLTGDMDQMPQDGEALKIMLKQLEEEELRLCELFVGTRTCTSYHKDITLIPTENIDNDILFRFSSQQGIVEADDLSGEPIYLTLSATMQDYLPDTKKSVKSQISTSIYYNQPGSAIITVRDHETILLHKTCSIAQFGISIPLPMTLFEKKAYKALFNSKTGNLIELTR